MNQESLKQIRKHFSKIGLIYFLGTLLIIAVQTASGWLVLRFAPSMLENNDLALIIAMIPMYVIAMPVLILLIRTVPTTPPVTFPDASSPDSGSHSPYTAPVSTKKMTVGQWIVAFMICFAGMYISNIIGTVITQLIGMAKGGMVNNDILNVVSSTGLLTTIAIIVIIAPVMEEILFRKLLIDRIVSCGEGTAVLISGLLFGLFHGNLNQFAYAFVLGLLFGFIYVKTRNIRYTILMHMVVNFMGSVLSMIVLRASGYEELVRIMNDQPEALTNHMMEALPGMMILMVYAFMLIGVTIAGIVLFFVNLRKFACYPGAVVVPKGKRFTTFLLNPGMLLFILFWTIKIILQLFE